MEERFRSANIKGRKVQVYHHRKKKFEAQQKDNLVPFPDQWWLVDGLKLSPILINRAIVVLRMIDAILRLPERLAQEFSQGLVRDSIRFVHRFKPVQIDLILQKLMSRRTEPGIPRATEMVFSNLDVVLHLLDLPELGNYHRMNSKEENENLNP